MLLSALTVNPSYPALKSGAPAVASTLEQLCSLQIPPSIMWIPGHSDIPGNELADARAKAASQTSQPEAEVPLACAKSWIKVAIQPAFSHERSAQTYASFSRKIEDQEIKTRKEATLLAQLRSGHCFRLRAFAHLIDKTIDASCPLCHEEDHTVDHWLCRCPGNDRAKKEIFGSTGASLRSLSEAPRGVISLARQTLPRRVVQ